MYFPTSLKLLAAVLLSARVVVNAADYPKATQVVSQLTGDEGLEWSHPEGLYFDVVEDDFDASLNPYPSSYLLYRVEGWSESMKDVFAFTTHDGSRIEASDMISPDDELLKSGLDQNNRYWLVWKKYRIQW